jgi:hypothetical protein
MWAQCICLERDIFLFQLKVDYQISSIITITILTADIYKTLSK